MSGGPGRPRRSESKPCPAVESESSSDEFQDEDKGNNRVDLDDEDSGDDGDFEYEEEKQFTRSVVWRGCKKRRIQSADEESMQSEGEDVQTGPQSPAPSDAPSSASAYLNSHADGESSRPSAPQAPSRPPARIRLPGFREEDFGAGISPRPPVFKNAQYANREWVCFNDLGCRMCPVRTLVWQVPAKVFDNDSNFFHSWVTPVNSARASWMAAVIGLNFTGMSKGFLSGNHAEVQRAEEGTQEDDPSATGPGGKSEKEKKINRVRRYSFIHEGEERPMFSVGMQYILGEDDRVVAVRIYKFIFDKTHSDSELVSKVMSESKDTCSAGGISHSQDRTRKKNLGEANKNNRLLGDGTNLEDCAGTQYIRITSECDLLNALKICAGTGENARPTCDFNSLGECSHPITKDFSHDYGGLHPLSTEYQHNARRKEAFTAWLVDFDGQPISTQQDMVDNTKYFEEDGTFCVPASVWDSKTMWLCHDPSKLNIFDLSLPRKIQGSVSPGTHLLALYKDMQMPDYRGEATDHAVEESLNSFLTGIGAEEAEAARHMQSSIVGFDTPNMTDQERANFKGQDRMMEKSDNRVPCRMTQIAEHTRKVCEKVISPWLDACRDSPERLVRHAAVTQDLIEYHCNRIEAAFNSKTDRKGTPPGWCAAYDHLKKETDRYGTASVAWLQNNLLTATDISVHAQTFLWIGQFFEQDCFIQGRDRRIMDEVFLHMFEQYAQVTFLLLLCGSKGIGKSLRAQRAAKVFPEGWASQCGMSSSKAGMNGHMESDDGCNVMFDEMTNELTNTNSTDRIEYWKQVLMNREYVYNRTVPVKNPDGTETHRTVTLITPNRKTFQICTNYGIAFTHGGVPNDSKMAMLDRSIAHLVRSIPETCNSEESDFLRHLNSKEMQLRLRKFRIFVCLVAMTKLVCMGVPAMQPNFAYAKKLFDHLDKEMIVKEYNLPQGSARKSLKRAENLRTMCAMTAVANVFMYRQTAIQWPAGKLGPNGKPQRFKMKMLYDVVRQLHPSPEQIFFAWSQGLDYNIGTTSHAFTTMTAICEAFNIRFSDWLQKPPKDGIIEAASKIAEQNRQMRMQKDGERGEGSSDSEMSAEQREMHAQTMLNSERADAANAMLQDVFGSWKEGGGMTRTERKQQLDMFQRQRKATSLYRYRCGENGRQEMEFEGISTIENVMRGAPRPEDAPRLEGGCEVGNTMPLWSSCCLASAVQTSMLYDPRALVSWCTGGVATRSSVGTPALGTSQGINFKPSRNTAKGGPVKYDCAWMRYAQPCKDFVSFAAQFQGHNSTIKLFDISPGAQLTDLCWLLSTKDNERRVTESPKLPRNMFNYTPFATPDQKEVAEDHHSVIQMRGRSDVRMGGGNFYGERLRRNPYSMVPDCAMQRRLDFATDQGNLPALMSLLSNKTTNSPPIRIVHSPSDDKDFVELSTSAAFEHTRLVAEAVLKASLQPGMENSQEVFTHQQEPAGLSFDRDDSDASDASDRSNKLPYSYDIVPILLALSAMERFYDPFVEGHLERLREHYKDIGFTMQIDELPHMCTRFVGFADQAKVDKIGSRLLISLKVPLKRNAAYPYVEAGDEDPTDNPALLELHRSTVSLTLGRPATDADIENHFREAQGLKSMSGVKGDLFSQQTYMLHMKAVLKERGMISDEHKDGLIGIMCDAPYGCLRKAAELVSVKINALIDAHKDMIEAKQDITDASLTAEQAVFARDKRVEETHWNLLKHMPLPDELDLNWESATIRNTKLTNSKLTYENQAKQKKEAEEAQRRMQNKRPEVSDESSSHDVQKRFCSTFSFPISGRGVQDSRNRQDSARVFPRQ